MRTDHMTEGEESELRSLTIFLRDDLSKASRALHQIIKIIRPIRDRNKVFTDERNNLEAQILCFEALLLGIDSFLAIPVIIEGQ
jgi:hypothetical protein